MRQLHLQGALQQLIMLTLPDFTQKKLITIFATADIEQQLKFWNSNLRLYKDGKFTDQISCHLIFCVFIIGNVTLSSVLIEKFQKHGISLILLNRSLRSYAEVIAVAEGHTLLRQVQYQMDEDRSFAIAKNIIKNKLNNQNILAKQYKLIGWAQAFAKACRQLDKATSPATLRAAEGYLAKEYFGRLYAPLGWCRRAPQTREDIPNFLLDIGYSFLFNYTDALLRLFGFDTYKGVYHTLYFQRKSLSCDVMEPLSPLIDKALIKAHNLKQINDKDFIFKNGSFMFKAGKDIRQKYTNIFLNVLMDHRD